MARKGKSQTKAGGAKGKPRKATKRAPEPKATDASECLRLYSQMVLIRRFEEEAGRQYQRAKAGGFLHLAIGEEATIVGTVAAMRPDDYLVGTYRTHGHALARGTEANRVMAELFGRVDGTSGGRGGSMHIFDGERRFMGGYGIVGGNLPIAAGLALACDYSGSDEVCVCMFGDGASNTGNFGETMNLAALWNLPVLFLCENNLYGMGTSLERHSAATELSHKAEGFGVAGTRVDGMDVLAVRDAVAEGIRLARDERTPTLIEAYTYRFRGHSAADPEVYREKSEVESWRERDPITLFGNELLSDGLATQADLDQAREAADAIVEEAVEFADASPAPELDSLYDNLYVYGDQVKGWYAVDKRSPVAYPGEEQREASDEARRLAESAASKDRQAGDDEVAPPMRADPIPPEGKTS